MTTTNHRKRHGIFSATAILQRLLKSKLFIRNFLLLAILMVTIFMVFSLYSYRRSRMVLQEEFLAASSHRLESAALAVDNHLMDMRYIIANLDVNELVRAFFSYKHPETFYDDFHLRVQEILHTYVTSTPSIDSIYVYSEQADMVLTDRGRSRMSIFTDTNWMTYLTENASEWQYFFRAKNDSFPFFLCVMKRFTVGEYDAAILININLRYLSQLEEIRETPYQAIYLVSDEGEILFRKMQEALTEPLSVIPQLSNYQPDRRELSLLISDHADTYTYSQLHSSEYPWSYVTITHLQEYTARLSSSRALIAALSFALICMAFLIAFFFSFRSMKPIQSLLEMLQEPQDGKASAFYNDVEIRSIVDQITAYIQQNQTLSDELSKRLQVLNETKLLALQSQINPHFLFNTLNMIHIQESEALGYNHSIPKNTLALSKLLRYGIESTDLVDLNTELQFVRMYLNILQERYGGKPEIIYDIQSETLSAKVPKLFIQPVVENAVFHGLSEDMGDDSTLTLSCHTADGMCIVSVKDNGGGMPAETLSALRTKLSDASPSKGSIGLKNVVTRMRLLYGDQFRIDIESKEGEGSVFTLQFPLEMN